MASLTDQFCPNVHDAPVTAAVYDPWSGVLAITNIISRINCNAISSYIGGSYNRCRCLPTI